MFVVVSPTYICHNHCVYLPSVTASIGFFYFLLNNLPPYMRSKTDSRGGVSATPAKVQITPQDESMI